MSVWTVWPPGAQTFAFAFGLGLGFPFRFVFAFIFTLPCTLSDRAIN